MKMRVALAILTYVPAYVPDARRRLAEALTSLQSSGYRESLFVVDDGSTDPEHLSFLDRLPPDVSVIRRPRNGGISRAKNTCLRVLADHGFDVGFIAEDDIAFSPGWLNAYLRAHEATGIEHFSWAWDDDPSGRMAKEIIEVRGFAVAKTNLVNGVLLSLTPRILDIVGGFRVLPAPWGHEHTNWTKRIIKAGLAPCFVDVVNSNRLISVNSHSHFSAVPAHIRPAFAEQNQSLADDLSEIEFPLVE